MPKQIITNLVFQGGSVKGAAYVGALEALESSGFDFGQIKRVAGTSAGAITATALAMGCSIEQAGRLLREFDFKAVLDEGSGIFSTRSKVLKSVEKQVSGKSWVLSKVPAKTISPVLLHRMHKQSGVYDGEYIRLWAEQLIQDQVRILTDGKYHGHNLTFEELHQLTLEYPGKFRDLLIVGANLSTGTKTQFCYENKESRDVIIADALRISMSIPEIFVPHSLYYKIDGQRLIEATGDKWVDGGLYDNYPITCFDTPEYVQEDELVRSEDGLRFYNPQTLGFRLLSKEHKAFCEGMSEKPKKNLDGLFKFGAAVTMGVRADLQEQLYNLKENIQRSVFIDHHDINMMEFNLSREQRDMLVRSGNEATTEYLEKMSANITDFPVTQSI